MVKIVWKRLSHLLVTFSEPRKCFETISENTDTTSVLGDNERYALKCHTGPAGPKFIEVFRSPAGLENRGKSGDFRDPGEDGGGGGSVQK